MRSNSRGESSGAVLDCFNYSLPTIINNHGSFAELKEYGAFNLPETFTDEELINALEILSNNHDLRLVMGESTKVMIQRYHNPKVCAEKYCSAIENLYFETNRALPVLVSKLGPILETKSRNDQLNIAECISKSLSYRKGTKQILYDITNLIYEPSSTTQYDEYINMLKNLILNPPTDYRVEPVYLNEFNQYRYARRFTCHILGCSGEEFKDDLMEYRNGDLFIRNSDQGECLVIYRLTTYIQKYIHMI